MEPTCTPRSGPHVRILPVMVTVAATLALLGSVAGAGIRDKIKSAKDKVTGQKAPEPSGQGGQAIEFDDTTLELTGELLDRLITCRKSAQGLLKDRPALVKRTDEISREIIVLDGKYGGEVHQNSNRRRTVANCMDTELAEIRRQRQEVEMQRITANPASAEKLLKLTAAINDAQMKGDAAALARLQRQFDDMYAPTSADTLAARKKCGPMPALHPMKLRMDALEKERDGTLEKLRDLEAKALKIQVEGCKITEGQIAMAWERIELYLQKAKHSSNPSGFSATELKALSERKAALEAALAG